ncbi:hypothetical protein [Streptomyces sp. NPDC059957]|uniref:hypothetical protein n=1 Tax=unclassified Streptomyces TaxID=2593676 RepID=UPI00365EA01B
MTTSTVRFQMSSTIADQVAADLPSGDPLRSPLMNTERENWATGLRIWLELPVPLAHYLQAQLTALAASRHPAVNAGRISPPLQDIYLLRVAQDQIGKALDENPEYAVFTAATQERLAKHTKRKA